MKANLRMAKPSQDHKDGEGIKPSLQSSSINGNDNKRKQAKFSNSNKEIMKLNPTSSSRILQSRPTIRKKKNNKLKSYPFFHFDEETAFGCELDDSDFTPDLNSTSSSSISFETTCSADQNQSSFSDQRFRRRKSTTPPRRFIGSSPAVECSPLSLSFHSQSSSSSICSWQKQTVPKNIVHYNDENRGFKTFSNYHNREKITFKKGIRLSYPKKRLMLRLIFIIFAYSVATLILTTTNKLVELNTENIKAVELKNFQQGHGQKSVRRAPLLFGYETQRSFEVDMSVPNAKLRVKRTIGGFISMEPVKVQSRSLEKWKIHRSKGIGPLLMQMYSAGTSSAFSHKGKLYPRTFSFQSRDEKEKLHIVREVELYPTIFSDNTQFYGIKDSADPALSNMEPIVNNADEDCLHIAEWQTKYYPTCNAMHELDISQSNEVKLVGKKGFWRNAWTVRLGPYDSNLITEMSILKTPK